MVIRFVDTRGQDIGYRFAFYNTVNDEFLKFAGEMAWDTKNELVFSMVAHNAPSQLCELLKAIMPPWTDYHGEVEVEIPAAEDLAPVMPDFVEYARGSKESRLLPSQVGFIEIDSCEDDASPPDERHYAAIIRVILKGGGKEHFYFDNLAIAVSFYEGISEGMQ